MALALTSGGSSAQSQAFQTGLAHGKVLAQTHAAQGKTVKTVATPDATTQLLDLLTKNVGQSPTQLSTQANTLAHNDVASQVAAFQQQQAQANAQATQRAQQINLAAQAAARYEAGLGDQTAASFDNAAKSEAGFAQGYSGQLQQTASDAAAKVQAGLAAVGAPAGQAPSTTQGTDLANVLYGLGGQIPANTLETAGQAAAAAQRQLPAATLGYGQQQASGTLGQGAATAAALAPNIANALAQQPTLAAQYLSQLGTQNNDAVTQRNNEIELASLIQNRDAAQTVAATKANAPKTFGSAASGYYTIDPTSGKLTQVTKPVEKAAVPHTFGSASTGYYTLDADGKATQLTAPVTLPKAPKTFGSAKTGYYTIGTDGAVTQITQPVVTPAKTPANPGFPNLTKTQVTHLRAGISAAFNGVPEQKDVNNKVIAKALPPVDYETAISHAISAGYSRVGATKMANRFYMPGQRGRPKK